MDTNTLVEFVKYCKQHIRGDEKGEAQIFLDRFFTALGYPQGLRGAGAECEFRVKDDRKKTTSFGDLVWKKRVLIEMKKKDENLAIHLQQATDYWFKLAGDRPQYIILCNFFEFWIYDFNQKVFDPVDIVSLEELPDRKEAFNFLLPKPKPPIFGKDKEDVTEKAAEMIAAMFRSMVKRRTEPAEALHYTLQCIVSLFAEDVGLLPDKVFTQIIEACIRDKDKSYDLIGGLFHEMNREGVAPGGYYKGVDYFNGGLFKEIKPIELTDQEINLLEASANKSWRNVNPAIFGSFFENNLDPEKRHKLGAHYTHEMDIKKIVHPVIVQPWMERIESAETIEDYFQLLRALIEFKILDPACGSGNFLFVAFREMKLLEAKILALIWENAKSSDKDKLHRFLLTYPFVNTKQFYGLDINSTAVEIAKVTLMVAKELSIIAQSHLYDNKFKPLPLDNLDTNIICADALLNDDGTQRRWPVVDAIIGNPPYQSKNKMQKEFGIQYLNRLRNAYPEISGLVDYCVYWFNKAHRHLKPDGYAGLIGTDTIRENYSRVDSLDYICKNGGQIFNAVSSQKWSGEAKVRVSIVNWKKGSFAGERLLYTVDKKSGWVAHSQNYINSSLSISYDVSGAKQLVANKNPKKCFQGQTHGHDGFLLNRNEGLKFLRKNPNQKKVLKPFLIGEDLVGAVRAQPSRFVIDFTLMDIIEAATYKELFSRVELLVLPDRKEKGEYQKQENEAALKENPKSKVNKHHINFLNKWWKLSYGREDLLNELRGRKRYIACSRVTQRPIFEFFSTNIRPNDKVVVFAFDDYYTFGVIQSTIHWLWLTNKGTTHGPGFNYNSDAVWDTFPWPQRPTKQDIERVGQAAKNLHDARTKALNDHNTSLRDIYHLLEQPGDNILKTLQKKLDQTVVDAYGFDGSKNLLEQAYNLNLLLADKEASGEEIQGPGWPVTISGREKFVTEECVEFDED